MKLQIFTSFFLVVLVGLPVSAQVVDLERSRYGAAAYYNYSEQGDVTIRMHVWGAIRYPGYYEVPRGTRLSEIVSLAGGPQFGDRQRRTSRTVEVKLHRMIEGSRTVIYQETMENEIAVSNVDPVVQEDDLLSLEAEVRQGFRWRDIFPVISMTGTIVLILDRISS